MAIVRSRQMPMNPIFAFRGEAEGRSSADILVDALDTQKSSPLDTSDFSPVPKTPDSPTFASENFNSKAALLPIVQAQRERCGLIVRI